MSPLSTPGFDPCLALLIRRLKFGPQLVALFSTRSLVAKNRRPLHALLFGEWRDDIIRPSSPEFHQTQIRFLPNQPILRLGIPEPSGPLHRQARLHRRIVPDPPLAIRFAPYGIICPNSPLLPCAIRYQYRLRVLHRYPHFQIDSLPFRKKEFVDKKLLAIGYIQHISPLSINDFNLQSARSTAFCAARSQVSLYTSGFGRPGG